MRRNQNRNLHDRSAKIDAVESPTIKPKKHELTKEAKENRFFSAVKTFGRWLKRVFWGQSTPSQPTFQKPIYTSKALKKDQKKRKVKRQMQRESRRKNRGANRG